MESKVKKGEAGDSDHNVGGRQPVEKRKKSLRVGFGAKSRAH